MTDEKPAIDWDKDDVTRGQRAAYHRELLADLEALKEKVFRAADPIKDVEARNEFVLAGRRIESAIETLVVDIYRDERSPDDSIHS